MARQWQCNPVCVLCNQEQERAAHLILHCPFARLVWERVEAWTNKLIQVPTGNLEIIVWWQKELAHLPKKTRRTKVAFMMYSAWTYGRKGSGGFSRISKVHQRMSCMRSKWKSKQEKWPAEGQRFLSYLMLRFSIVFEYFLFYVISNL